MKPCLVVLSGSLESHTISLGDTELLTIGRALKNDLAVPDGIMSREHAVLKNTPDGFSVIDLNSQNGVFVNSTPIKERLLKHGDRLCIGQTYFLFLTEDDDGTLIFSDQIQFVDDLSATLTESPTDFESGTGKLSPDVHFLSKMGAALNNLKDGDELQKRILEITLEIIPAERGAIILLNDDFVSPHSVCVLNKRHRDFDSMQISRSITRQVLAERTPVLVNEVSQTNSEAAESLLNYGVHRVLCVPLLVGEISGLMYLDSSDVTFKFNVVRLQQLTAIANLTAAALKNIRHFELLTVENKHLQNLAGIETEMIGESEPMKKLQQLIGRAAGINSTVLISGESGTGKELVALAIHKNSPRRHKPLIALNCATLTENFLDSELFGHEKGSFTGAVSQRKGKIELAEGGTLFLDEIGELAPALQAKLLRFLQDKVFERIGGQKSIKADVRLIAATNRNLSEEVKKDNFREDLYFRLNVVPIEVQPLRRRKSDIPVLTQHFIRKHSEECSRLVVGISRPAQQALVDYDWRGNIRELGNVIERIVALGSTDIIQIEDLPFEITENPARQANNNSHASLQTQIKEAKSRIIINAVKDSAGNYTEAARRLDIHPNNLHRLIRELEIDKNDFDE